MKILIAVDGSASSFKAIDALVARLGWFAQQPSLVLVYVHPALPYPGAEAWVGKDAVEKYYRDEADAILARASEPLQSRGVSVERVMLVGDAAHEIVRHAAQSGCDLIAMGTRGHTAIANLVLGSVATKVLAASPVPVLLMH